MWAGMSRDTTTDITPDTGEGRWLTYRQIGGLRRISKASAERLVRRHKWRRQEDNQGVTRVLVPPEWAEVELALASDSPPDIRADGSPDITPDTGVSRIAAGPLAALEDAVAALREQLDATNARAERAEAGREGERARADDLRAQIDVLNAERVETRAEAERALTKELVRGDQLSYRVDSLQTEVRRAEERADGIDADRRAAEAKAEAERSRADALRDRLNTMQEQLADAHAALQAAEAADARAKQAEAGRTEERGRADRAEAATSGERARADALRDRTEALQAQLTARQEVIDAAEATRRAEDERRARGRWARLRAAWRGVS